VCLFDEEAAILRSLPTDLGLVVRADPPVDDTSDPVVRRLYPTAYTDPTETDAEGEFQRLMHEELVGEKLAALEVLRATLDRGQQRGGRVEFELVGDEVDGWLRALNDARLALGTRLGVTEDTDLDLEARDPADPEAQAHAVYVWLGWAQESLLEAISPRA